MKKMILFAVSLLSAAPVLWAQQAGTQPINADSVPIEEYVPKVVIEGKWGTGQGEFGKQDGYERDDVPSSLAVDGKGNIYVLDYVNNRIQKFSKEGEHILDIPVDGFVGRIVAWNVFRNGEWFEERKRPEGTATENARPIVKADKAVGINIVIDSKDTMYYYLKRIKDGKEIGEVWEFKNDKLVSKKSPNPSRTSQVGISKENYVDSKVDAEIKELQAARNFSAMDKKNRQFSFRLDDGETLYGQRRVVYDEGAKKWVVRIKKSGKIWDKFYGPSGKPLSVRQVPELSEFIDSKGNYYFIETSDTGVAIRKNEVTQIKK